MTDLMPPTEHPAEPYCLAEVDLFRDLPRREMAALGARAPLRTVRAGQVVYTPLQPAVVLFIIKRGRIRLYRIAPDGRSVTTAVLGPGTVFGEMDILGLRMHASWADALEASELCLMSRTDVQELLFTDPRIVLRIAEQLSTRVADLEVRLTDLTCKACGRLIVDVFVGPRTCRAHPIDVGGKAPSASAASRVGSCTTILPRRSWMRCCLASSPRAVVVRSLVAPTKAASC